MFFSVKFLLLLLLFITVTNSRPSNNYTNEAILNDLNDTPTIDLSDDSSNVAAKQYGDDIQLIDQGYHGTFVDLILSNNVLDVIADLEECMGESLFCYESESLEIREDARKLCSDLSNYCGFRLHGRDGEIKLINDEYLSKTNFIHCDRNREYIRLKYPEAKYCTLHDDSCKPKIGDDGRIKINVKQISPNCPIRIKNAQLYYPPTSTTSYPTTQYVKPGTSNASMEWYIWVIIIVGIVVLICVIIILFVCWKKQICFFKKKTEIKKKITITDTVNSTIITKAEEIPDPKNDKLDLKPEAEPKPKPKEEIPPPPKVAKKSKKKSKKSKKQQKKKNTVEEAPPPPSVNHVVTTPAPDFVAPPPSLNSFVPPSNHLTQEQVLDEDYYYRKEFGERAKRLKSKSSKSGSSRKSNVYHHIHVSNEMILEPHYSSLRRCNKLPKNKCEEFEQHYKIDPAKQPLDIEVSLLCDYIGDIFATINRLIDESQAVLKEKGAQFHKNGRAKKFPALVYEYLEDSETPEFTRYTAMGSEIGQSVFLDETRFKEYSLSLLLLIGFTKHLSDKTRRHALAILRRKLPKIRHKTTVEEREKYGYPANAIELAYERDSRYFNNIKAIKTNSTENVSEVTQE